VNRSMEIKNPKTPVDNRTNHMKNSFDKGAIFHEAKIPANTIIDAIRTVAVIGSTLLLILSFITLYLFLTERSAGNTAEMLFTSDILWYPAFNIHYSVGVDGVSVAMLLLASIIVFAGYETHQHQQRYNDKQ